MDFSGIYGSRFTEEQARARFEELKETHRKLFNRESEALFSTPGRTELAGNHTDHNNGVVLAASINLDIICAVSLRDDLMVNFNSKGFRPFKMSLTHLKPVRKEKGTTKALIRGIAASIVKRDGKIGGFNINLSSDVPSGSGLSSSAALEVLIATVFNSLFNKDYFSTTELAVMGQEAENRYFRKPCGLMDQIACANGGAVGINFYPEPAVYHVDADFSRWGLKLVIINTDSSHAGLTGEYAAIPAEMKAVARYFGKNVLGEVDEKVFFDNLKDVRKAIKNDRAVLRAIHFFNESRRAQEMLTALKDNNREQYLALMRESGSSSYRFLQNIYVSSDTKNQGVSFALALAEELAGSDGAVRVHGGGFAGTIQALVSSDKCEHFIYCMEKQIKEGCCTVVEIRKDPTEKVVLC